MFQHVQHGLTVNMGQRSQWYCGYIHWTLLGSLAESAPLKLLVRIEHFEWTHDPPQNIFVQPLHVGDDVAFQWSGLIKVNLTNTVEEARCSQQELRSHVGNRLSE